MSKERSLDDLLIKQKKGNENDFDGIFEWMRPSFNVAVAFFPEFIQAAVAQKPPVKYGLNCSYDVSVTPDDDGLVRHKSATIHSTQFLSTSNFCRGIQIDWFGNTVLWTFYLDYGQYVNNEPDFQGILVGSDNRVSQELAIQMVLWLFEEVPVIHYERHGFQRYGIIQPTS